MAKAVAGRGRRRACFPPGVRNVRLSIWVGVLLLSWVLGACGWATFGDDDDDDDDDSSHPVLCADHLCLVSGGIRTLDGPARQGGALTVHSDGLETNGRSCGGSVCVSGGLEP
jgi:hypothetical protein